MSSSTRLPPDVFIRPTQRDSIQAANGASPPPPKGTTDPGWEVLISTYGRDDLAAFDLGQPGCTISAEGALGAAAIAGLLRSCV